MKKIFLILTLFISAISFSQIYTPYGITYATTNSSTTSNIGIAVTDPNEKLTIDGNINLINPPNVTRKIGFTTSDSFIRKQIICLLLHMV